MAASSSTDKPFAKMTRGEKLAFLAKLLAFICTFGFAYPTLLSDEYVAKYR